MRRQNSRCILQLSSGRSAAQAAAAALPHTTLRLAWTRARSDIKSARATYGPAKFIREILNIPRRTDGKRRSVQHGRSWCPFIGLVAALLSRQRVTSTVRSCAIVGRVCQARLLPDADGSFAIKNNSLTKTQNQTGRESARRSECIQRDCTGWSIL